MCGINGITASDVPTVTRMNEALSHRGPDGKVVRDLGGVTFGHTRLAILDLSKRGDQPMQSADGRYTITYNGELYNYRELRELLESEYSFSSDSDTEVLLAAFSCWGSEMFSKLRGIFAFAIYDAKKKTVTLARDHMGVKPLYYYCNEETLIFSSELSGILTALPLRNIDATSLALFFSIQYTPTPHSLIEGVKKMHPGEVRTFNNGASTTIDFRKKEEVTHCADTPEELYGVVDSAVKSQLVSERPLGVFLSGGLDSSIILHHTAAHSTEVKTYSARFEMIAGSEHEGDKFNTDADVAERTAKHYGTTHTTCVITLDMIKASLVEAFETLDEPIANPTVLTTYLLSKEVRKDETIVVLGGDGGDEFFAGYERHRIIYAAHLYQKLPQYLRKVSNRLHRRLKKLSTPLYAPMHTELMAHKDTHMGNVLTHSLNIYGEAQKYFDGRYDEHVKKMHPLDAFMEVDRTSWLPEESLMRSDRASMSHGIEYRVPFLDQELVAYADQIPVGQKLSLRNGKLPLRVAYKNHLPEYLFSLKKRGWLSPAAKWLRHEDVRALIAEVFSDQYYGGLSSLVNWDAARDMLDTHAEKRGYHVLPLWHLLQLQIWARKYKIRYDETY